MGVEEVREAGAPPVEQTWLWPYRSPPGPPGSHPGAQLCPWLTGVPMGTCHQNRPISSSSGQLKSETLKGEEKQLVKIQPLFLFKNKSSSKSDHVYVSLPILKITYNSQVGGLVAIYFFTCRSWTQTREKSDFSRTMKRADGGEVKQRRHRGKKEKYFPALLLDVTSKSCKLNTFKAAPYTAVNVL